MYNEVEVFDLNNEPTVQHNNCQSLFKLSDPHKFQMYNVLRAQDGSAKCMGTDNINLLKNIQMRGTISNNIIVPYTMRFLQVSTIQEEKWIDVCCYYSLEFTSTLLSNNNVLISNNF